MSSNRKYALILFGIYFLFFFGRTFIYAQLEKETIEKVWITIPKNVSVFHILVTLTPSGESMKPYYEHPLYQVGYDFFKESKDHPAVNMTDQIFRQYLYFAFNYISFYFSDFPEAKLKEDIVIPPEYDNLSQMITQYINLVRDFYVSSNFESFWDSHLGNAR